MKIKTERIVELESQLKLQLLINQDLKKENRSLKTLLRMLNKLLHKRLDGRPVLKFTKPEAPTLERYENVEPPKH